MDWYDDDDWRTNQDFIDRWTLNVRSPEHKWYMTAVEGPSTVSSVAFTSIIGGGILSLIVCGVAAMIGSNGGDNHVDTLTWLVPGVVAWICLTCWFSFFMYIAPRNLDWKHFKNLPLFEAYLAYKKMSEDERAMCIDAYRAWEYAVESGMNKQHVQAARDVWDSTFANTRRHFALLNETKSNPHLETAVQRNGELVSMNQELEQQISTLKELE